MMRHIGKYGKYPYMICNLVFTRQNITRFRLGDGAGVVSDSAVESGGAGGLLRIIVGAGAGA